MNLAYLIVPELILVTVACVLFLLGTVNRAAVRHLCAVLALATLAFLCAHQLYWSYEPGAEHGVTDQWQTLNVGGFATYVKLIVAAVGALLVLLSWPTNRDATGSPSVQFGRDAGEFFGLLLLSIAGVFLVASSNDIILLFLGVELASIPTYIMVSVSRPLPAAQEAGVKYFFLGAMAAAVMLFGFSYLYGTTGHTKLTDIADAFDRARPGLVAHATATDLATTAAAATDPAAPPPTTQPPTGPTTEPALAAAATNGSPGGFVPEVGPRGDWQPAALNTWHYLAIVMLLAGLGFKIAAVPLHGYVGDVYQGAATPVTALLAFVPKTSGFVAILKVLFAVGGPHWAFPPLLVNLVVVVAALTMTVGNVLGLLQLNVKRVLAYSSIAHSGYMLVGVAALMHAGHLFTTGVYDDSRVTAIQNSALQGVLFYLFAYGLMNAGAFGVLMLLPSRAVAYGQRYAASTVDDAQGGTAGGRNDAGEPHAPPATTAETYEDLAGEGKRHPLLGLAMAVCCFSLIGLPLTVGFFGKVVLIKPALDSHLYWLVVITMVNAAVSAAYYLRIVAAMFLRPVPEDAAAAEVAMAADEEAGDAASAGGGDTGTVAPVGGSLLGLHHPRPFPVRLAVAISVVGTVVFGAYLPATDALSRRASAALLDPRPTGPETKTKAAQPASVQAAPPRGDAPAAAPPTAVSSRQP